MLKCYPCFKAEPLFCYLVRRTIRLAPSEPGCVVSEYLASTLSFIPYVLQATECRDSLDIEYSSRLLNSIHSSLSAHL